MRFEQRYEVRSEDSAFRHLQTRLQLERDETSYCIDRSGSGSEQTTLCSLPWDNLFDVPRIPAPETYYLQGRSRSWLLEADGTASLTSACGDAAEHFRLSAAERRAIGAAARRSGFFQFPADLMRLPSARDDGLWTIRVAYGCSTSDLELALDGHQNRVRWNCDTAGMLGQDHSNEEPQQIQPLLDAIALAYAAHFPIQTLLPYAQCPTMLEELARRERARH